MNKRLMKKYGNPKKILFLDCDGVLNSETYFKHNNFDYTNTCNAYKYNHDIECIKRLKKIIKETNCKIVLSSTWKFFYFADDRYFSNKLRKLFNNKYKIRIIDRTTFKYKTIGKYQKRAYQIKQYLLDHKNIVKYAILDDDSNDEDDLTLFGDHFVPTTWTNGLQDEHVNKCIKLLK